MFYTIRGDKKQQRGREEDRASSTALGSGSFPLRHGRGQATMGKVSSLISSGGTQEVTHGDCAISQGLPWRGHDVSLHQPSISNAWPQAAAFPFCLTLVLIPLICTRWRPLLQCCRSVVQTSRVVAKETEISFLGIVKLGFSVKKAKKFYFGKH